MLFWNHFLPADCRIILLLARNLGRFGQAGIITIRGSSRFWQFLVFVLSWRERQRLDILQKRFHTNECMSKPRSQIVEMAHRIIRFWRPALRGSNQSDLVGCMIQWLGQTDHPTTWWCDWCGFFSWTNWCFWNPKAGRLQDPRWQSTRGLFYSLVSHPRLADAIISLIEGRGICFSRNQMLPLFGPSVKLSSFSLLNWCWQYD